MHQLKIRRPRKKKKRIGRGGKRGTYSGKGIKGQRARAGRRFEPIIRSLIKRYPKLRGYRLKPGPKTKVAILNLDVLEKNFAPEAKVSPQVLLEKRLIRRIKGRTPQVKILAKGQLKKSLQVQGCLLSKKAKEAIEKAGGQIS